MPPSPAATDDALAACARASALLAALAEARAAAAQVARATWRGPARDRFDEASFGGPLRERPAPVIVLELEKLGEAVDLIIVPAVRESLQFANEVVEPGSFHRQEAQPVFQTACLANQPRLFVPRRPIHDRFEGPADF